MLRNPKSQAPNAKQIPSTSSLASLGTSLNKFKAPSTNDRKHKSKWHSEPLPFCHSEGAKRPKNLAAKLEILRFAQDDRMVLRMTGGKKLRMIGGKKLRMTKGKGAG